MEKVKSAVPTGPLPIVPFDSPVGWVKIEEKHPQAQAKSAKVANVPPSFTSCGEQAALFSVSAHNKAKRGQLIWSKVIAQTDDGRRQTARGKQETRGEEMKKAFARCRAAMDLRPKETVFQLLQTTVRDGKRHLNMRRNRCLVLFHTF